MINGSPVLQSALQCESPWSASLKQRLQVDISSPVGYAALHLITRLTVLLRRNLPEHSHLNKQLVVLLSSRRSQFTVSLLNNHSNSFKKKIFMTLTDIKKGK